MFLIQLKFANVNEKWENKTNKSEAKKLLKY